MPENENENPETPAAADAPTTANPVVPPAAPPVEAQPVAQPVAQPAGPRFRDTVWNFRSMLAVAAASLLIGGLSGAAIVALADGDDGPDRARVVNFGGPGLRQGP